MCYSYDLDGNITNLMRDDGNGSGIDNLSYAHPASGGKTINNRLNHIVDHTTGNGGGAGVVDQDPDNYSYDATGNLIGDAKEGITSITWTPYNKIRELVKTNAAPATGTTTLRYLNDAAGNRVVKDYHATQNTTLTSRTWTIRDAQGTVLAIYTRKPTAGNSGSVTRTEAPIYGSSRIGQSTRTATYDATASGEATLLGTVYSRELGKRAYELVDHLGNVRATISDILVPRTATNTYDADILTLTDYYPFGMQMDTRTWEAGGVAGHRYGYNGKENDDEVKGQGNQQDYGLRVYDPRIGRWLSVDPLCSKFPSWSAYQNAGCSPIALVDREGDEWELSFIDGNNPRGMFEALIKKIFSDKVEARIDNANKVTLSFIGDNKLNSLDAYQQAAFNSLSAVIKSETITKQKVFAATIFINVDSHGKEDLDPAIDVHDVQQIGHLLNDYRYSAALLVHAVVEAHSRFADGHNYSLNHQAGKDAEGPILGMQRHGGVGSDGVLYQEEERYGGTWKGRVVVPYSVNGVIKNLVVGIEDGLVSTAQVTDGSP